MTSKKYCKSLAEIDNSLRFQRGSEGEFHGVSPNGLPHTDDYSVSQELSEQQLINGNNNSHHFQSLNRVTQQTGSTNHVYPNGWIPVLESYKVKPGQVKKVIIFGRDLIVTRSVNSREVNVLDAYCPHMGVHIGIGGQVKEVNDESCIQCPFHGWLFRSSDGKCVKIPYQKHQNINNSSSKCIIPKQAKLDVWLSIEVDNFIYVWHHIDNQPPDWHLVPSDLLKAENRWTLIGRSFHKTNLELRDVLENGADMNHFEGIHNDLFLFGSNLINLRLNLNYLQKYTRHHWQPEWKPILNEHGKPTHKAEMKLQSWISFFKFRLFDITVKAIQNGPARVDLYYNSKWYGKGLLIMNAIPCGGRRTKYIQHIYTERSLFQCLMAKNVLFGEIKMVSIQIIRNCFRWSQTNLSNCFAARERFLHLESQEKH